MHYGAIQKLHHARQEVEGKSQYYIGGGALQCRYVTH